MTDIITTKDLTKNELIGAKILAGLAVLAGFVVVLNFAQMEQKDLPELSFTAQPSQAVDGTGLVSFGAKITKISDYDIKLKVESLSSEDDFLPVMPVLADIDSGSIDFVENEGYQIKSESDEVNLNFIWDSKAAESYQNISSEQIKIKITLVYKLKDKTGEENINTDDSTNINSPENLNVDTDNTNINSPENLNVNSEVIINTNEATIEEGAQIEPADSPADSPDQNLLPAQTEPVADSASTSAQNVPADSSANILPQSTEGLNSSAIIINTVTMAIGSASDSTFSTDSDWSEITIISDNFRIDNAEPELSSAKVNLEKAQIYLSFNEAINTDLVISNEQIKLQDEILAESTLEWQNKFNLIITLSEAEKEKYTALPSEWIFQIDSENNIHDLSGNKYAGGLISLIESADEIEQPAIEDEDNPDDEKDEEKVEEEIIIPQTDKIINTRGYNKNCSFNPDELIMSAGATSQAELNLIPLDFESKYVLTANTLPNDFEVKILQPSGTGTGPIKLEITAPANAVPRLYKLLIKYQDFTPQSVSHVNNCVLRLTLQ